MSDIRDEYSADLIAQAEAELREEEEREEIEKIKAVLVARRARFARLSRFWSLIKAAFRELV